MQEDGDCCGAIWICVITISIVLMVAHVDFFLLLFITLCLTVFFLVSCLTCNCIYNDLTGRYQAYLYRRWLEEHNEYQIELPKHEPETIVIIQNPDSISIGKPCLTHYQQYPQV